MPSVLTSLIVATNAIPEGIRRVSPELIVTVEVIVHVSGVHAPPKSDSQSDWSSVPPTANACCPVSPASIPDKAAAAIRNVQFERTARMLIALFIMLSNPRKNFYKSIQVLNY